MADAGGLGAAQELKDIRPADSGERPMTFSERVEQDGLRLTRTSLDILQVNVGKLCNQACQHCHVDAGPARTEIMERETVERILKFLERSTIQTVDITGGAPELNPH